MVKTTNESWQTFKDKLKDNLWGYFFTLILGSVTTIFTVFITKPPTDTAEIKKALKSVISKRVGCDSINTHKTYVTELGLNKDKMIILIGDVKYNVDSICTFIAFFESEKESLWNKLIGRPGFYTLNSFTIMSRNYEVAEKEDIDLDEDGLPEVYLHLNASFADRTTSAPLFFRRDDKYWEILTIPSIQKIVEDRYKNINPTTAKPILGHIDKFNLSGVKHKGSDKKLESLKENPIFYEEKNEAIHNDKKYTFYTYSNGGKYTMLTHPLKKYKEIAVLDIFDDGMATLAKHYSLVQFFKIEDKSIKIDNLWNWGYPMYSDEAIDLEAVSFEELQQAGFKAHIQNGKFWGYTDFERIN